MLLAGCVQMVAGCGKKPNLVMPILIILIVQRLVVALDMCH